MARKGAMGRDPKAGGGRASVGRDQGEMLRYREALNRAKGMDVNSEAYARNKAIAEATGAKYGLNWQKGLTTGAQPQQQQDQRSAYEQELNRQRGPQLDTTPNAQGQYRLSPGVYGTKEQAAQSYDQEMYGWQDGGYPSMTGGGRSRNLRPEERLARGIDPRDPNRYSIDESGRVSGTLIGWEGMGVNYPGEYIRGPIPGATQGIYNAPQPPQQDMTANKQGKYRLSPGVYGNKQQAEQQQARDMEQYNQQQEAARAAMQAVGPQQQDRGGGGGFREDFYKRAFDMQQQNLGGIASGARDYYKGVGREVGDYYGGIAKGAGGYYGGVAKKIRKLF